MAFKWYTDADCTTEFGGTFSLTHRTDLSDNPQDMVLYGADVDADPGDNGIYQYQADVDFDGETALTAGTDPIQIKPAVIDSDAAHTASEISLALTSDDLESAEGGATLDLGVSLLSGLSNVVTLYIRVTNAVTDVGNVTNLELLMNGMIRMAVE